MKLFKLRPKHSIIILINEMKPKFFNFIFLSSIIIFSILFFAPKKTFAGANPCQAASCTFYIDFVGGSDSNDGLQKTSDGNGHGPWKHAPGMTGATGVPGSVDIAPGGVGCDYGCDFSDDKFIFKGGVTWDYHNFPWVIREYGTAGHPLYIGVDPTWYTGGVWSRPILDAGGTSSNTICDYVVAFAPMPYVEFDNFEFTRIYWDERCIPVRHDTGAVGLNIGAHNDIHNLYIHAWSHGTIESGTREQCVLIQGSPEGTTVAVHDSVIDGSESLTPTHSATSWGGFDTSCDAFRGGPPTMYNLYLAYVSNGEVGAGINSFHDSTCDHIGNAFSRTVQDVHDQCFEDVGNSNGGFYYNNLIRHIQTGLVFGMNPAIGHTVYFFNNVLWDIGDSGNGINCTAPANAIVGGTCYQWNNTIESTNTASAPFMGCGSNMDGCYFENNHFIGPLANTDSCPPLSRCHSGNNILQLSKTIANSNGYYEGFPSSFPYHPTLAGPTVGVGTNLSSWCNTMPALCSSATAGVGYNQTNHTVIVPNATAVARGSAWDIGAYQYGGAVQDTQAPIISNINSSAITSSSATITWNTDENSDSQIIYSTDTNYGSQTSLGLNLITAHSQTLTGLTANTTYHFKVKSRDAAGNLATSADQTFTTITAIPIPGDFNLDHTVNSLDYSLLNSHWYQTSNISTYDLVTDGLINTLDFSVLKSNWGKVW